jgi:hypothetical protein
MLWGKCPKFDLAGVEWLNQVAAKPSFVVRRPVCRTKNETGDIVMRTLPILICCLSMGFFGCLLESIDDNQLDLEEVTDSTTAELELSAQMDICWNQAIPAGYVVIAHKTTTACQGTNFPGQPNTRTIKEPNPAGEIVCEFPLPTGYVITTDTLNSTACKPSGSTSGWNALNVKLATAQQETVCSNSPIPPGYSASSTSSASFCRTGFRRVLTRL